MIHQSAYQHSYFANCISLGCDCTIASSMQTIGIRSFAGPFDWSTSSSLPRLLSIIESDFKDFLKEDHLVPISIRGVVQFTDLKYDFRYPHDLRESLFDEYEGIRQKYQRRIDRFREATKSPTAFIRAICNEEEIAYINRNRAYIERIIKKGNPENEIVFMRGHQIPEGSPGPSWGNCLPLAKWDASLGGNQLWHAFDSPLQTHDFMTGLLAPEQIKENLFFYSAKFLLKLLATEGNPAWPLSAVKIASVMKSVRAFFTGKDWYIWGAGCYGQSIKGVLDAIGIRIQGFIDSSPEKQGKEIGGLCIYKWEDVADGARNVFIAMKNRDAAGQVQERVRASSPTASVCSFDDLRAILSIFLQ